MATGLKQRTQHHTLHAEPLSLLEKALENSMRPSSLHIGCARSAQRACAKRARANMQAPFIFKSLHPGNDTTSLHNAQNMRRTTQPHEAIDSLGCSHAIFMLTQILPIGSSTPAQDSATDSSGAQNTSSPVLIGHCVALLSDPAHAKAETWGGTFPHTLPSLHPENPAEPAKPIALQATAAEPLVNPSRVGSAKMISSACSIRPR